jgi:exodeoxyribonuclease V beta subunit
MAGLPGGASFGSLVHGVLETVDTQAPDLDAEIELRVAEQLARWGSGGGPSGIDQGVLAAALLQTYETPLGPAAGDRRLRDIPSRDRLTELTFELPLAGGDRPGAQLRLGAVGPLLARHLAQRRPPDPLAGYGERLADPVLRDQPLRGFLNGSLDAVLRLHDGTGCDPRYLVVDYKTNWLGSALPGSGRLTAADYTPQRMAESMISSDYPLQALLYSVALHRFLRWRQPGYDPAVHLGGVLYLYLRGMCGVATPVVDGQPCGVFAWSPPPALVTELSQLLDAGGVP